MKKFFSKISETIKKKWLIKGTTTILLVATLIIAYVALYTWIKSLNVTPIDVTEEKLYTLSEESKKQVENIDQEVNIYFVEYEEDSTSLNLAKQYNSANEKIKIETVTVTKRPDLAEKYGFEEGDTGIIVESGEKSKILSESDLYTYNTTTYETIDITEEKLTNAIVDVTTEEKPKVYFITGYGKYTISNALNYLSVYIQNEIIDVEEIDPLVTGKIPDDCDTLVITTPSRDIEDTVATMITDYIQKGGNILWFNSSFTTDQNFVNIQKVLDQYGVSLEKGAVRETDTDKILLNTQEVFKPTVNRTQITQDVAEASGVMCVNPGRINVASDEKLEELKVEITELLTSSENSYFRKDLSITDKKKTDSDEEGSQLIGALATKTIEEDKTSKLIIYADNYFVSDGLVTSESQVSAINIYNNKDLALNSIAYLTEKQDSITIRKDTGTVTYTATEKQHQIVLAIIFAVPALIIIAGITVGIIRKRKK